ncbi:MAG: enoyl-CoA hydratase/isomerase family protein, partial [Pseudomonadota bacterium]
MTTLPKTSTINCTLNGGWLTIAFNSPENRNALNDERVADLSAVLDAIRDDRTIRGVTLTGEGGVFCAGGDLKAFSAGLQGGADKKAVAEMNRAGGEIFEKVAACPQVVLALVEGAAIAGGLGLACCADIIVVTRNAKFALTETQLGIIPAQIAPYVAKRIGFNTARRLMLTGARFQGDMAKEIGLTDYLVDDASGLAQVEAEVKAAVFGCAPGANASTKALLQDINNLSHEQFKDRAASDFADCLLSEEGREG